MARADSQKRADDERYIDTGIYKRRIAPLTSAEVDEWFASRYRTAAQLLEHLRAWLTDFIKPYIKGPLPNEDSLSRTDRWYSTPFGGWCRYRDDIPDKLRDTVEDAVQALEQVDNIQRNLPDEHELGAFGPYSILVRMALDLGRLVERVYVRQFESHVKSERGRREGARGAAEITNEAHAELRPKYQPAVDLLMADGCSYTAACEQVASSFGVNERTVRDNTSNPAPRNRGRWTG